MITPAYPNQRKHEGLMSELKQELVSRPHYIYLDEGEVFSNIQPRVIHTDKYYDAFEQSKNTVLFWSSKTRLHSTKAIYAVKDRTITFDKVIDTNQGEFEWVGRNLCLAAFGAQFVLKEEVDWLKIPSKFMEINHSKGRIEDDFVRIKIKDL